MAKRPTTVRALVAQLRDVVPDSPATLSVTKDGVAHPILPSETLGVVAGERYVAFRWEGRALFFELDRRRKAYRPVENPDEAAVAAMADDLLPEPEEPEEVKAMRETLAALKPPKGYRIALDPQGRPTLEAEERPPREMRQKPIAVDQEPEIPPAPEAEPDLAVGMILVRKKDGHPYRVSGIDERLKKAYFDPVDEGDPNLAALYPAPTFWKGWART